jgi:DNA-binding phage protein
MSQGIGASAVAKKPGIGRASVYRVLKQEDGVAP